MDELRKAAQRLEIAGTLLANCAHNLSQLGGKPLSPRWAVALDEYRREWDGARSDFRAARALAGAVPAPKSEPHGFAANTKGRSDGRARMAGEGDNRGPGHGGQPGAERRARYDGGTEHEGGLLRPLAPRTADQGDAEQLTPAGGAAPAPVEPPLSSLEVPRDLMERIYATLGYYANVCTYEGKRTGGVLAGCPRGPKPSSAELTFEALRMLKQIDAAVPAPVEPPLPHVGADEDGGAVLEWWSGERKLTLYAVGHPSHEALLKSWGPHMDNEMEFVPLTNAPAVRVAFEWLAAVPAPVPPADELLGASASPTACSVASLPEPKVSALRVPPAGAWADAALKLMDEADVLIRWAAVSHPEPEKYKRCAKAFWDVCHMLAEARTAGAPVLAPTEPTFCLESLTGESGTDYAVSLSCASGKFYSKWRKHPVWLERIGDMLRDEFGFRDAALEPADPSAAPAAKLRAAAVPAHVDLESYERIIERQRKIIERHEAVPAPVEPPAVTDEMVTAYLTANDTYWREADALSLSKSDPSKWRQGTPKEATRVSLQAALAAVPPLCPAPPSFDNLASAQGCQSTVTVPAAEPPSEGVWITAAEDKARRRDNEDARRYRFLMAAPPPALLEPLTETTLEQLALAAGIAEARQGCLERFARAIERAHGIGTPTTSPAPAAADMSAAIAVLQGLRAESGVNDDGQSWLHRLTRGDCINALRKADTPTTSPAPKCAHPRVAIDDDGIAHCEVCGATLPPGGLKRNADGPTTSTPERESAQRERMATKFAGRAQTAATADFDLPAPNDNIGTTSTPAPNDEGAAA